ncbi:MAG: electron transfer flavoprotein subunit alpha/FixB family protein [Desulfurococcales archaeon]|nr:electron transfer flavoprotein subunit alpha/FixB family protein [Desulfurococcales archaeon]
MVKVLVVAHDERSAGEALSAFGSLGEAYVLAYGAAAANAAGIAEYGVKVYKLDSDVTDVVFEAVKKLYEELKPSIVAGVSSKNNKDVLSRLAGLYDIPMTTDAYDVEVGDGFVRYKRGALSARAVATEKVPMPAIVLLAPRKYQPAEKKGGGSVEELHVDVEPKVKVIERQEKVRGGVNLEEAEIIVSVGRGFKKKEDLKLAFELAELLGAQIGCSRPIAADLKWLSEDHWVGLSGKKVAPKLYIAIGISGAPQHIAGITDSKIIVAINKDKSAQIFKHADYGVVADLYQFLPVLIKKLKERMGKA